MFLRWFLEVLFVYVSVYQFPVSSPAKAASGESGLKQA
jgi:hypothetical protein